MIANNLINVLRASTKLSKEHITNILKLLEDGATIPFIARYRKELTGGASDEVLREFEAIYQTTQSLLVRKEEISRLIRERATLTQSLMQAIDEAQTLSVLEDIYRPYKEKKSTRATEAVKKGLTPLANTLRLAKLSLSAFKDEAKKYAKNGVLSTEEAIVGAQDILAEQYADNPREREAIRNTMLRHGLLVTKPTKKFQSNGTYKNLANESQKIAYIPSHRYLAIMRAVKEKELTVKITIDMQRVEENIKQYKIPRNASSSKEFLLEAYKDGLKRLLLPSIEREVHKQLKEKADSVAIGTFGKNLSQLLMTPPVSKKVLLGVDPAFVSGCKLAVIDTNAHYLDSAVIYPTSPKKAYEDSKKEVLRLIKKYQIQGVAIGNGTGSQETQEFFATLNAKEGIDISYTVVSEAGASVYSASKIAQEEYPQLDVTIRGAISIAQRVRDPLATFVKIDPKSLGIGQYQHDVNQKLLQKRLDDVTEDIVNRIGVDINSASFSLLSHVAGIGERIAKNIIDYREEHGNFQKKSELLCVKGLGKKAYEQAAGFIRIKDAKNPLDNSGIHPESFEVAKKVQKLNMQTINTSTLAKELNVGEATLKDIVLELKKPGFDPRTELEAIPFQKGMRDISHLQEGSIISGVVRNITDFGAFVDIGLKNDGMIHISKMSEKRISHPLELLSINQYLPQIQVLSVDRDKGKIGLGLLK